MHRDHAQYGKNSGMILFRDHHCCFPPSSGRMVIESSLEGDEMKKIGFGLMRLPVIGVD